jgi:signal transduction histidine kinase/ActR/RegA family two-component response regulator
MADSVGSALDPGVAGDHAREVSRGLLHALVEELSRQHHTADLVRRFAQASAALERFPEPAGLFGGIAGNSPILNRACRRTIGDLALVPRLVDALDSAQVAPTVQYLADVPVPRPGYTGYYAVTVQSLRTAVGALVVCEDVTDQVLARQLGVGADALVWCMAGDGKASYFNERWRSAVVGDLKAAIHRGDAKRWSSALRELERSHDPIDIDVRLCLKSGDCRWHRVRLTPGVGSIICSASDASEEHERDNERDSMAEQVQRARAEAERANQLKDVFLAAVSHELRAPLTTMLLWEKVLRESFEDEASRSQALDAIHQSAVAQARLVADLLDFARGISGKLYLDIREVDLGKLVSDAVDAARPHAAAKSILLVHRAPPLAEVVHADATRLRQIIDNLLSNAVKFTDSRGTVTVAVARRRQSITIEIEDTGRGLAPKLLTRIFEPFAQADDSLTRREGGLGLGLTISKQLTELHRGTLTASSAGLGQGAKFTVTLPAAGTSRSPSPPLGVKRARRLDGARVLVVDDDAEVRKALAVLLGRVGAIVETAESADAARAQIAALDPQALVCDIAMPGEDGYTFVRTLRAAGSTIPSIALTAFATELDTQRAIDAGFDVHLTKPISLDRLVEALSDLLGERSLDRHDRIT